ncbi:unnamed protein product [Cyprideis torosa]|uniref:non-specific serine/threonine protein kinase n=1 Tax=Cyprideis torosa TaxID=163714 RepID=A0A7R8W6U8_9CRUS|nr:unnamed protein product [Cyprideis torosa]CAG0882110.1 unnamed protein product [Cyprideis torosa]
MQPPTDPGVPPNGCPPVFLPAPSGTINKELGLSGGSITRPCKKPLIRKPTDRISPDGSHGNRQDLLLDEGCYPMMFARDVVSKDESIQLKLLCPLLVGLLNEDDLTGVSFCQLLHVKLIVNDRGEPLAMKSIDLSRTIAAADSVLKETRCLKALSHENIIRFIGQRKDKNMQYIFLEYAPGGELFDRIEPDVGMPEGEARRLFLQLINGVDYMHSRGIAHRDLKPENLLLDAHDNLKITDFGFATLFRHNGVERKLDKRCGTIQYVAPEVLAGSYHGQPADIWSCGIILVAMLSGELPWDQPLSNCESYRSWREQHTSLLSVSPWSRLPTFAFPLLRKILCHSPVRRMTIQQIKAHPWAKKKETVFTPYDWSIKGNTAAPALSFQRCISVNVESKTDATYQFRRTLTSLEREVYARGGGGGGTVVPRSFSFLQLSLKDPSVVDCGVEPKRPRLSGDGFACTQPDREDARTTDFKPHIPFSSFSQPAALEDLLVNSQTQQTQTTQGTSTQLTPFQRLVKRMTRFIVKTDLKATIAALESTGRKLTYQVKQTEGTNVITLVMKDKRRRPLSFKVTPLPLGPGEMLLDFRLSKGDGLEFKRAFMNIKRLLLEQDIIVRGLVTWPVAHATNTVPY